MAISFVVVVSRLLVAALLGGLIGLEREAAARGAGARTHALVALGSALFTVAGAYGFADAASGPRDPSRIAAQLAAGVGFIGAGAVIRNGSSVSGVTTAATVWLAAAVGLAAAAGRTVPAGAATAAALAVLVLLRAAEVRTDAHTSVANVGGVGLVADLLFLGLHDRTTTGQLQGVWGALSVRERRHEVQQRLRAARLNDVIG